MSKKHEAGAGWAVVTGASSGLGALFAEKLAQRGLPLVLAGRDEARLTEVRQRVQRLAPGIDVELVVGDLGRQADLEALVAVLNGRVIDVLVNNAGFGTYGRLPDVDADRDHELIAVNVDALVRLTHEVLPGMLARGHGRILNVASTIAFQPAPYQATYGASKAFVLSFSQALWAETRGSGVTVTALCPGPTRTGFVDALDADVSSTAIYGRLASPEPVVAAGLRALDRGRPVVVPGLRNWVMATAARYEPRMGRGADQWPDVAPRRRLSRPRRVAVITGSGLEAAEEAARIVAAVRDDPAGRIRLAADAYAFGRGGRRYRPYRRAVVAFMRWQQARGVLNPLDDDIPGSPWWRAVNEDLLRDTVEAKLLIQRGDGQPSRPSVARWVNFFDAPSAQSWYGAHNASVVAGYLAHAALAALEAPAERFFMNVVLVRVLYAHALVLDGDLALGRLSFLARLIGHPRSRGPQALLSMKDVLPDRYPIQGAGVEELIDSENRLGRMVDYGVIGVRVDALYATSARALGEPRLLDLIVDGAPAYAWPADQRHVWKPQPQRRFTSLIEFLTRPRDSHMRLEPAMA